MGTPTDGNQTLLESHPEIAAQANGWDPSTVSPGSGRKLSWKCGSGHIWEAVVSNRSRKNYGCPICSNKKILPGYNDLKTKFPDIAKQANGWDPSLVSPMSNKKLEWKCASGHIWQAVVGNRTFKKYGCPICSNQQLLSGYNDLATRFPEIAVQAYGWDPKLVAPFSNESKEWICDKGHVWSSKITNRTSRGDGCAICSSHKTLAGFNDLLTTNPELAKEAFGWDPTSVSKGSNKKLKWKCANGHFWESVISARSKGSGCPYCGNHSVLSGFNDLATKNLELSKEAIGWDPRTFSRASNKKVTWQCHLGHIWTASIANRTKGSGCPVCSGKCFNKTLLVALSTADSNKWSTLLNRGKSTPKSQVTSFDYERTGPILQRQRRLTDAQALTLGNRYREGATVYQLAKEFGISRKTVSERLKKAEITMRRQSPGNELIDSMVGLYESGLSLAQVGDSVGTSTGTFRRYLLTAGVQMRDSHGRKG